MIIDGTGAGTENAPAVGSTLAAVTICRAAQVQPGSPALLEVVAAADTALQTNTEFRDIIFDLSATRQWVAGSSIGTQRAVHIIGPTYAFDGASTLNKAITLHVIAPTAGTNATITNSLAAWFQGQVQIGPVATLPSTTGAKLSFGQSAEVTPTIPGGLYVSNAAHTACTASVEIVDFKLDGARTLQFATGALTLQRSTLVTAPTYAFVGASTITQAATLAVNAAPVAGTNATITDNYALLVQAGRAGFGGQIVGNLAPVAVGFATVSFPTDANMTISTSQAANPILNVTSVGTLTATRNVILPANPQAGALMWVINGTTGAQSIQVIGQSGTGVTIATAKRALLSFDGTNVIRLTADQ